MFNLFKKFTVEQIHAEIDTAQERLIDSADKLLAELNIPTESRLEAKANTLEKLGFVNSEPVKQAATIKENRKKTETILVKTKQEAELLRYYKQTYPFQKFLTVAELERICEKYNLIYAPAKNYIKDIPEKNVFEMANIPTVWVVGDATVNGSESGTSFRQALYFMECGFKLHDTMIYAKENPIPLTHNRYEQSFEYMFVFSKGVPKTFNPLKEKCITMGSYNHRRNTGRVAEAATRNRDEKNIC